MQDGPLTVSPSSSAMNPFAGVVHATGTLDPRQVAAVVLAIVFGFWSIYTLVAAYHLLRYGHRSWFAIPAVIVHVSVSAMLALYAISGLA